MDVRMPDGVVLQNVPDGTPKDEIMSRYQRSRRMAALPQSLENAKEVYSPVDNSVREGFGKAFVDIGRGVGQLIGTISRQDVAQSRELDKPLMATTGGKIGNLGGNIAATVPAAFVPGANTVAGAGLIGALSGLLQPSTSTRETLTNIGLGGAFGAGGQKIGQVISGKLANVAEQRLANAAATQSENAPREAILEAGRKLGYVTPPAARNRDSMLAAAAESVGGKAATAQSAAYMNQKTTNRLIREDLGLDPAKKTISLLDLKTVRNKAGQVYKQVSSSGTIKADQTYIDEIASLANSEPDVAKAFPGTAAPSGPEIEKLADSLFQPKFGAAEALKRVRSLRSEAKADWKSVHAAGGGAEKEAIARAKTDAAGILEDMIIRHLQSQGKGALADSFDGARTLIAKSYDAEAALNDATGNVVATKLGGMLRKGKPLGGNFKTVAEFARTVDPSVMKEQLSGPGVSKLQSTIAIASGVGGLASGNPVALSIAGLPALSWAARKGILSKTGQALAVPSYAPGNALINATGAVAPYGYLPALGTRNALVPAEQ